MSKRITIRWKQTIRPVSPGRGRRNDSRFSGKRQRRVSCLSDANERGTGRRISCRGRGSVSHVIAAWQLAKKEFTHGH